MIVRTKKYQLDPKTYRKIAMGNIFRDLWWVFLIPITMISMTFVVGGSWWWIVATILTVLYVLFWWIQFTGVAQMPQYQTFFQRMGYEIDSRFVMIKVNPKQGMPIQWDKIKKVRKTKKSFIMILSKAQMIYLPYRIFNNQNDIKFVESILKRKSFLK